MALELITPPVLEPVSIADLSGQLQGLIDPDEAKQMRMIKAARMWIEDQTCRAFIAQTWRYTAYAFPCKDRAIELERAPLDSVVSVKYYDENNILQTLIENTDYYVDNGGKRRFGGIVLPTGKGWPSTTHRPNAVQIEFIAGSGDTADSVGDDDKHLILILSGWLYGQRDPVNIGNITSELSFHFGSWLAGKKAGGWVA